jgi:hypothetical protein
MRAFELKRSSLKKSVLPVIEFSASHWVIEVFPTMINDQAITIIKSAGISLSIFNWCSKIIRV